MKAKMPFACRMRGFTLIELVVVITIMVVLTALLLNWPQKTITLDAQAQQLMNDIRYIQFYAMTTSERTRINFSSNQYTFTKADGSTAILQPALGSNTISLDSGITLTTTGLPSGYLVFDQRGIPYVDNTTPGTALSSNATIILTASGGSAIITISPDTGALSLS